MRISDWSSDVCSSDLRATRSRRHRPMVMVDLAVPRDIETEVGRLADVYLYTVDDLGRMVQSGTDARRAAVVQAEAIIETRVQNFRSEEHTSELQSLMRISYAVFCLKKKKNTEDHNTQ